MTTLFIFVLLIALMLTGMPISIALGLTVLTFLFFLSLFYHAWIGIRDLWMDYIKPVGLRLTLHVFTIVWLVGCSVYSVKVVWGM